MNLKFPEEFIARAVFACVLCPSDRLDCSMYCPCMNTCPLSALSPAPPVHQMTPLQSEVSIC